MFVAKQRANFFQRTSFRFWKSVSGVREETEALVKALAILHKVHHHDVENARADQYKIELPSDLVHGYWAGYESDFAGEIEC
jgi:hypothetical protein